MRLSAGDDDGGWCSGAAAAGRAGGGGGGGCCSCLCLPVGRGRRGDRSQYAPPPQQVSPVAAPVPLTHAAPPPPPPLPHTPGGVMQRFCYENRGKCCQKLLRYNGCPNKVLLFPEEGWARSAASSYWTLTPSWWSRSRCTVVEVAGTRRCSAQARMVETGAGSLYVVGSFKRAAPDPDFKLFLTANVSASDFNMGYSMTGTLERGSQRSNCFQMTHFAVIRRHDHK